VSGEILMVHSKLFLNISTSFSRYGYFRRVKRISRRSENSPLISEIFWNFDAKFRLQILFDAQK
jgi:hypothetical protein